MKKKNGRLLEDNVLGLVITVFGLLIFFGFIAAVVYSLNKDSDRDRAEAILDLIITKAENVKDGETGAFLSQTMPYDSPVFAVLEARKFWSISSWDQRLPTDDRPGKCVLESCLCICPEKGDFFRFDKGELKDHCEDRGICKPIDIETINVNMVKAYNPSSTVDQPAIWNIYSQHRGSLFLSINAAMGLHISREGNIINITRYYLNSSANSEEVGPSEITERLEEYKLKGEYREHRLDMRLGIYELTRIKVEGGVIIPGEVESYTVVHSE